MHIVVLTLKTTIFKHTPSNLESGLYVQFSTNEISKTNLQHQKIKENNQMSFWHEITLFEI